MVNVTKIKILEQLKIGTGFVSGQYISNVCGISRVAVWKNISKLREMGYEIKSAAKGYRLLKIPDLLISTEFPQLESPIIHYDILESTMKEASKKSSDITFVIADKQTMGRGRMGRTWESGLGGIYCSIFLKCNIPISNIQRLNILASNSIAQVLIKDYGVDARIKWPNDVVVNSKKISGILIEVKGNLDIIYDATIGVGINISNVIDRKYATNLNIETTKTITRKEFFGKFIDSFLKNLKKLDSPDIIEEYRELSSLISRKIKIKQFNNYLAGVVQGFDETGALILQTSDGKEVKLISGEVLKVQI